MADPGFANGGPRSSAAGASIEAPKAPRGWGVNFFILDLKMSTSRAF